MYIRHLLASEQRRFELESFVDNNCSYFSFVEMFIDTVTTKKGGKFEPMYSR